jgi:hypothetical protein
VAGFPQDLQSRLFNKVVSESEDMKTGLSFAAKRRQTPKTQRSAHLSRRARGNDAGRHAERIAPPPEDTIATDEAQQGAIGSFPAVTAATD